jgi:hypothetical protein
MGRSARQRRLKSVDPFNPLRGRILAAERKDPTKNLPVDEKRDEKKIPRKLREIMHGQKKLAEIEGLFFIFCGSSAIWSTLRVTNGRF